MSDTMRLGVVWRMARAAFAALALILLALPAAAQNAQLTILHFNDFYELTPKGGVGGAAQLMTLIERERAAHPNTLTILGGDFLSPSVMSGIVKGAQMVDVLNAMGVDMVAFGNHEFDFGPEVTKQRIAEAKFAWLGTNVHDKDGTPFPGSVATLTRMVGDVKLGFFGLTTPETAVTSSGGAALLIDPPIEAARAAVKTLEAEGAHVIVAITHLTIDEDRALTAAVPEIDLVLGGHEHIPISYFERGTLVLKSGSDGLYLGAVDLDIATTQSSGGPKTQVATSWRMLLNRETAPEPRIAALVKTYTDRLDSELGVEIGRTEVALDSRTEIVRGQESSMGDLIADAMRELTVADAALTNGGGIRGNAQIAAGSALTRKQILTELPFGNLCVLLELSGADLEEALENGVSQVEKQAGRFPQVSGMTLRYDPKAAPGHRVVEAAIGGKPLDPAAKYRVATNDFLVKGGDGYASLARGKPLIDARSAPLLASLVMDYIAAHKTVKPEIGGRVSAVQ